MRINELLKEYYFHDSLITYVSYSCNQVKIDIELCNWKQNGYVKSEPEMDEIELVFSGVTDYKFDFNDGNVDYDTILEVNYSRDDKIKFILEDEKEIKILEFYSTEVEIYKK